MEAMARDLIDREPIMHDLMSMDGYEKSIAGQFALQKIASAPEIDAVEVVRCKDCIFYQPYIQEMYEGKGDCEEHDAMVCDDDFCSYGTKG